jgi:hypothetical protein
VALAEHFELASRALGHQQLDGGIMQLDELLAEEDLTQHNGEVPICGQYKVLAISFELSLDLRE